MAKIQGKRLFGYILFQINGTNLEYFLDYCTKNKIVLWDIERLGETDCIAKISWLQYQRLLKISDNTPYEITIREVKGILPAFIRKIGKKELLLAALFSFLLLFVLSNMIWKLEIAGVSKEMDVQIREELQLYGIYPGAWGYQLENLDVIQQRLLNDIPGLLYLGVSKQGTTYKVDAIEKLIEKKEKSSPSKKLIATKNGIVEKMYIKSGIPVVQVQDFVKKGDILISGKLEQEDTGDEKDKKTKDTWIGAEGKVYANTWYEINMTIPLNTKLEKLSGDYNQKFGLKLGNMMLPIWGFWHKNDESTASHINYTELKLLSWQLPVSFWEEVIYDKDSLTLNNTEKEAMKIAKEYITTNLPRQLGQDAEIIDYKVLHQSLEGGKVNLNLYISVIENIAEG